jgi:hypothetical protein
MELLRANLVRTFVPLVVGAVVSVLPFLAGNAGISTLIGFAFSAVYYAFFRIAETRYPWLGAFLGKTMNHKAQADTRLSVTPNTPTKVDATDPPSVAGTIEVVLASPGQALGIRVGGQPLPAVESMSWTAKRGESTILTIELRDAPIQFSPSADAI